MKHEGRECKCGDTIRYDNSSKCVSCNIEYNAKWQKANRERLNLSCRIKRFSETICGPKITQVQAMRGLSVSEFGEFKQLKLDHPLAFVA